MSTRLNIPYVMGDQVGRSVTTNSFCPIFRTQLGVMWAYAYATTAALISAAREASGLAEGDIAPGCFVIAGTTGTITGSLWVNTAANNSCSWAVWV